MSWRWEGGYNLRLTDNRSRGKRFFKFRARGMVCPVNRGASPPPTLMAGSGDQ